MNWCCRRGAWPSIKEDREFRNCLMFSGKIISLIEDVLLTQSETPDSLTQSAETDHRSARRATDRKRVWDAGKHWQRM